MAPVSRVLQARWYARATSSAFASFMVASAPIDSRRRAVAQVHTCTTVYWSVGGGRDRIDGMGTEAVLRALAEPNRQAILKLVRDKPHSVGEIGEHFDISQQAVSQHLQILTDAGLLNVEQQGKRRLYVVNPDG